MPAALQPLRKILKEVDLTIADFASKIGISTTYAHALLWGKRPLTEELMDAITVRFGVHPDVLRTRGHKPLDCEGKPYTKLSFYRHQHPTPREISDEEVTRLAEPFKTILLGAARAGRLDMVKLLLHSALRKIMGDVDGLASCVKEVALEKAMPTRKYTVGEMRADPGLAAMLGYEDDLNRRDDDVAVEVRSPVREQEAAKCFDSDPFATFVACDQQQKEITTAISREVEKSFQDP